MTATRWVGGVLERLVAHARPTAAESMTIYPDDGEGPVAKELVIDSVWEEQVEWVAGNFRHRILREPREVKATKTLLALLDDRQRAQWETYSQFTLTTPSGVRLLLAPHSFSGNVFELDESGWRIYQWCVHVRNCEVPLVDNVISQLLTLRYDEGAFWREVVAYANTEHTTVPIINMVNHRLRQAGNRYIDPVAAPAHYAWAERLEPAAEVRDYARAQLHGLMAAANPPRHFDHNHEIITIPTDDLPPGATLTNWEIEYGRGRVTEVRVTVHDPRRGAIIIRTYRNEVLVEERVEAQYDPWGRRAGRDL